MVASIMSPIISAVPVAKRGRNEIDPGAIIIARVIVIGGGEVCANIWRRWGRHLWWDLWRRTLHAGRYPIRIVDIIVLFTIPRRCRFAGPDVPVRCMTFPDVGMDGTDHEKQHGSYENKC